MRSEFAPTLLASRKFLPFALSFPRKLWKLAAMAALATGHATWAENGVPTGVTPLTASEFEAYVTGKTITYVRGGKVFGVEEYLPKRRVRWARAPRQCEYGTWQQEGDQICFSYPASLSRACWTFWTEGGRLKALVAKGPPENVVQEYKKTERGLVCPPPKIGS